MEIYDALGLTDGEKKVYKALIELKSTTTGPIYKHSKVSQSKVYEILVRLKNKGLASHIVKNKVTYWQPADPRIFLEKISEDLIEMNEKKKIIEKELPKIVENNRFIEDSVVVYEDFDGFRNALLSFQDTFTPKDELLVFSSPKTIPEPYWTFLLQYTVERVRKKTNARIIYGKDMKNFASELHGNKRTLIRYVDIITPSTIGIGPDRVIFMNWNEKPKFIVLRGEEIVKSYHSFFESFWRIAK